ncbi:MAG: rRNA maturation RNase YbeY [Endomicrobiales bacterium]
MATKINSYCFPGYVKPYLAEAARRTLAAEKKKAPAEINLVLVADEQIRRLNRTYRRVDRVTDVISFRVDSSGDIYIAEGRSKKQAGEERHTWKRELAYLVIHGVLHLLGHSDYTPGPRRRMFKRQDAVWKAL